MDNSVSNAIDSPVKKKSPLKKLIIGVIILSIVIFFINPIFLRLFVLEPMKVPTGSMLDTIQINDHLYVNKLIYRFREAKRGELVVFWYPDEPNIRYVKRVIGVENDKVEIKKGKLYVNDELQIEPYIKEPMRNENFGPYSVPANSYFMLGDNRNNSKDSRYWANNFVSGDLLIGKIVLRYYPFNRFGAVK